MRKYLVPFLFAFLVFLFSSALCEAADVTGYASFAGKNRDAFPKLTDSNYRTNWKSGSGKDAYLEVTLPESHPCGTVYVQWHDTPLPFRIMVEQDGQWVTLARTVDAYYNSAVTLPTPQTRFRVCPQEDRTGGMSICEISLYGPGRAPDSVQFWEPTVEKADLMLLSCHPDDEVLWFGGALPTYAGERKMNVLCCILVPTSPHRRIEYLDSLWTCGVRTYPVWGTQSDQYSTSLRVQYTFWSEKKMLNTVTGWYRKYKPSVVLSHDIGGEYGHGGHRVCADLCIKALKTAADPDSFPESAREWGTWDVPKLYLHLYRENAVVMTWDVPLYFFGGRTGLEVAREAFKCHVSQQTTHYAVRTEGTGDCTRFGLYRSLVGEDEMKNDFFEHLYSGYNPFEVVDD